MTEEYVDPEFPEMESQPEVSFEYEGNPELDRDDFYEETPISDETMDMEQTDLGLIESSPYAQDVFSGLEYPLRGVPTVKEAFAALEYPPCESPTVMSPDSEGVLFLPGDDPIQQQVIAEPLDFRLVYTRPVPQRLRHLTCERRGQEYPRPAGLYRPGN